VAGEAVSLEKRANAAGELFFEGGVGENRAGRLRGKGERSGKRRREGEQTRGGAERAQRGATKDG
jgi:hypothetical protein